MGYAHEGKLSILVRSAGGDKLHQTPSPAI